MTQEEFAAAVRAGGYDVNVWLVYAEDRRESMLGAFQLRLLRAFWRRGEAYAFGARAHVEAHWQHFYVFRLAVDAVWASSSAPRRLEFEAIFEDAFDLPPLEVTPAQVAAAFPG